MPETLIETHKQVANQVKKEICRFLKWDEMAFAEYQYHHGISYLMWTWPCDENARCQLERSAIFWNWFKNLWLLHDESFLSYKRSLTECSQQTLRQLYDDLHCPRSLSVEVKPNSVVLSEIKKKEVYELRTN